MPPSRLARRCSTLMIEASTAPARSAVACCPTPGSTKTTSLFPSRPHFGKICLNIKVAIEATPVVAIFFPFSSLGLEIFGLLKTH